MTSGAMPPGGLHAVAPGGLSAPRPGGVSLGEPTLGVRNRSTPNFNFSRYNVSGARVVQACTANVHLGKATAVTSYLWTLPVRPGGSASTVTTGTAVTAGFTPDVAGLYVFRCVVTFNDTPATVVTKEFEYTSA